MAEPDAPDTSRISPTAHYTAFFWYRNGLSHPALATSRGRLLYGTLQPLMEVHQRLGWPTLGDFLIARHLAIDALLSRAIEAGRVGQVIEVAAGLSPRGWRFARRYADAGLVYLEADLPGMARHKRDLLERAGLLRPNHSVEVVNALADSGPESVAGLAARRLDPKVGTAIITEGLLNYFDQATVEAMWRRFSQTLATFPAGLHLADIAVRREALEHASVKAFLFLLRVFVRGRQHIQFEDTGDLEAAACAAGFGRAKGHDPRPVAGLDDRRGNLVRLLEAWT